LPILDSILYPPISIHPSIHIHPYRARSREEETLRFRIAQLTGGGRQFEMLSVSFDFLGRLGWPICCCDAAKTTTD
jgi:hypothetical protein